VQRRKLSILVNDMRGGGAERVISLLVPHLNEIFEVFLVLIQNLIEYDLPDDIPVHILEKKKLKEGIDTYMIINKLAKKYAEFCRNNDIEISMSFLNKSNFISSRARSFYDFKKHILCERSYPSNAYSKGNLKNLVMRKLISYFYNKADIIITNSKLSALDLKENFKISTKIETIYNPLKLNNLSKKNSSNKRFTFINIGNLYSYKGHAIMIEAFSKIKNTNTQLQIIGKGPLKNTLLKQIKENNLQHRIELLGYQKNVVNYLQGADCFILSSRYEGFPNVLLEALEQSLSIISTDCKSGPREILAPSTNYQNILEQGLEIAENGVLVPVNNPKQMKNAMELIIENKQLRDQFCQKAKARVKSFDVKEITQQFINTIRIANREDKRLSE